MITVRLELTVQISSGGAFRRMMPSLSYHEQPFAMRREAMLADATITVMAAAADRDDTTGI